MAGMCLPRAFMQIKSPPCAREGDRRRLTERVLKAGTEAQPLSHGCAVPAPLAGEPRGIREALVSLGKEVRVRGEPWPPCVREAVSEADWRVGVPVGLFAKTGTETQPLSHGFAVPAPLAGEPRVSGKP